MTASKPEDKTFLPLSSHFLLGACEEGMGPSYHVERTKVRPPKAWCLVKAPVSQCFSKQLDHLPPNQNPHPQMSAMWDLDPSLANLVWEKQCSGAI